MDFEYPTSLHLPVELVLHAKHVLLLHLAHVDDPAIFLLGIIMAVIVRFVLRLGKQRLDLWLARDLGKVLLSAPKLPQFKGAAAKTGVPPEGNILL